MIEKMARLSYDFSNQAYLNEVNNLRDVDLLSKSIEPDKLNTSINYLYSPTPFSGPSLPTSPPPQPQPSTTTLVTDSGLSGPNSATNSSSNHYHHHHHHHHHLLSSPAPNSSVPHHHSSNFHLNGHSYTPQPQPQAQPQPLNYEQNGSPADQSQPHPSTYMYHNLLTKPPKFQQQQGMMQQLAGNNPYITDFKEYSAYRPHPHPEHRYSTYTPICFLNENEKEINLSGAGSTGKKPTVKTTHLGEMPTPGRLFLPDKSTINKRHSAHIDSYSMSSQRSNLSTPLATPGEVRTSNEKLLSYSYYSNLNYDKTSKLKASKLPLNGDVCKLKSNDVSLGGLVGSMNKERKSKSINNVAGTPQTHHCLPSANGNCVAGSLGSSNNTLSLSHPTSSSASNKSHQESPLYQKIMSRLSELPDSVLLRNYASTPNHNHMQAKEISKLKEEKLKAFNHAHNNHNAGNNTSNNQNGVNGTPQSMSMNSNASTTPLSPLVMDNKQMFENRIQQFQQLQQQQQQQQLNTSIQSTQTNGDGNGYTTASLPAMRITQKSLKAFAKGNLIVLKKSPNSPSSQSTQNKYISTIRIKPNEPDQTPLVDAHTNPITTTTVITTANNEQAEKPTIVRNTNTTLTEITPSLANNTISAISVNQTGHHVVDDMSLNNKLVKKTSWEERDYNNNNNNNSSNNSKESRRGKHKSLYIEPFIPELNKLEAESSRATTKNLSSIERNLIDIRYETTSASGSATDAAKQNSDRQPVKLNNQPNTSSNNNNKTNIFVKNIVAAEVIRSSSPFNKPATNQTIMSKQTYRIQDLVFRDEDKQVAANRNGDSHRNSKLIEQELIVSSGKAAISLNNNNNNSNNNGAESSNGDAVVNGKMYEIEKFGKKVTITNANSIDTNLNIFNTAFNNAAPFSLPAALAHTHKTTSSSINQLNARCAVNPSPLGFRLTSNRDVLTGSVKEKLSAANTSNVANKTKRYSQLIDTTNLDKNRNHPLIDNLIIQLNKEDDNLKNRLDKEAKVKANLLNLAKLSASSDRDRKYKTVNAAGSKDLLAKEMAREPKSEICELIRHTHDSGNNNKIVDIKEEPTRDGPNQRPASVVPTLSTPIATANTNNHSNSNPKIIANNLRAAVTNNNFNSSSNSNTANMESSAVNTTVSSACPALAAPASEEPIKPVASPKHEHETSLIATCANAATEEIEKAATFGQSSNDSFSSGSDDLKNSSFKKIDLKKFDLKNINFVPIDNINTAKIMSNYPVHYTSHGVINPATTAVVIKQREENSQTPVATTISRRQSSSRKESQLIKQLMSAAKAANDESSSSCNKYDAVKYNHKAAAIKQHRHANKNLDESLNKSLDMHSMNYSSDINNSASENGGEISLKSISNKQVASSNDSNNNINHAMNTTGNSTGTSINNNNNSSSSKAANSSGKHSSHEHQLDEFVNARGLRKISTPPPLPHILDATKHKFNRLMMNNAEMAKLEAKSEGGKYSSKQSITTSIRESSKHDKASLSKATAQNGLPPAPPPPPTPALQQNRATLNGTPVASLTANDYVSSSNKSNESKNARKLSTPTAFSTNANYNNNKSVYNGNGTNGNQNYAFFLNNTTTNGYSVNGNSNGNYSHSEGNSKEYHSSTRHQKSSQNGETNRRSMNAEMIQQQQPQSNHNNSNNNHHHHQLGPNSLIKNSKKSEEKTNNLTNLPQLDRIDYVLKTNDEKILTNITPQYVEEKKSSSKNKSSIKAVIQIPGENRKQTKQQNNNNNNNNNYYNDKPDNNYHNNSPLPWNIRESKNGKNFYENYARENDRRKKEGNGFLMLLPGIAIPIDTDAGDSDDASSSN